MIIRQKQEGGQLTVIIEGEIDTGTAPELMEYLKKEMPGTNDLILDFAGVDYISSAGLRVLLFAQKGMSDHGKLTVTNVNDEVMEVFELTCFTDIINII